MLLHKATIGVIDIPSCRFLADLLISYFQMAIASILTDKVTEEDILSSQEKLLLSYVRPDPIFEEKKNSARKLGPCLIANAINGSGQGWTPSSAIDGLLIGVRGIGPLKIKINAIDALVGGASAWIEEASELEFKCLSGLRLSATSPDCAPAVFLSFGSSTVLCCLAR
jgi:hypothetical protein